MFQTLFLSLTFGIAAYLLYDGLTDAARAGTGTTTPETKTTRVADFLTRAGLHDVTPRDFILFSTGAGLASGLAAQLFLGWSVMSVVTAGLGAAAPFIYYVRRHDRRREVLQEAMADAIAQLRDSIRTGLSVQEALAGLARNGPASLRPEFTRLVRETPLLGFELAVSGLRERLADPVTDTACAALLLNELLGGRNVGQVLDQLARATRAQYKVQQEIRAHQAKNVLTARIVALVPLVVLMGIRKVNPGYLSVFSSASGQLLMAACLVAIALGYAAMLWMTRLPADPRVLS